MEVIVLQVSEKAIHDMKRIPNQPIQKESPDQQNIPKKHKLVVKT